MNNDFLVIIDAQKDFIDGSLGNENAQKVVPRIIHKIYSHFGPIIATMDTHNYNYLQTLEGRKLPIEHCIGDTDGWMMHPEIAKAVTIHGNYIGFVKKETFGSLALPSVITQYINNMPIESSNFSAPTNTPPSFTLVGFDTDICVISNALILRAAFPDAEITIDSRCCAGTTTHNHRAALDVARSCHIIVV